MLKRRSVVGGLAALAAAGLEACSRSPGGASEGTARRADSRHLLRHVEDSPRTLDPALNTDVPTQNVIDDLFEGLTRLDAAGKVIPAVATRWTESDDGLTWNFELRRDARWSNGDAVTAHDFVYAWRRLVDPATRSQSVQQVASLVSALAIASGEAPLDSLGVVARGDHALEVRLRSRTPWFTYLLTNNFLMPVHRATVEGQNEGWTRPGAMVSNGPFVLASQVINGPMRLERNPHHPDTASIRLDAVTYFPVTDRSSVTSRYLAGDLDITNGFQISDYGWLAPRLAPGELRLAPYFGTVMFGFHSTRAPFDNVGLRQAMSMAIDREIITDKLLQGLFLPAYSLIPPLPGYEPALPEWAKLARGAAACARARAVRERRAFPLRIRCASTSPMRWAIPTSAASWKRSRPCGAACSAPTSSWPREEFRVLMNNRRIGRHRLAWHAWIGDYPDPLSFLELWRRDSGQNFGGFDEPRLDALLDQALLSPDEASRHARYREAEALLADRAISLPIYYYQSRHLLKPWVRGFADNAMDRHSSRDLWLDLG